MRYVVTAGYVTVETAVPGGRASIDIPRGAMLPDDVPDEQVRVALRLGLIAPLSEPSPEPGPVAAQEVGGPPPKGGAGSGLDAWAAYARANGATPPAGATRDQIQAVLRDAGIRVD